MAGQINCVVKMTVGSYSGRERERGKWLELPSGRDNIVALEGVCLVRPPSSQKPKLCVMKCTRAYNASTMIIVDLNFLVDVMVLP